MPALGPVKRRDLIRYLRELGFSDPESGGKHEFVTRGALRVWLPNPHGDTISRDLLSRLLRQAGISRDEWERL